MHTLHKRTIVGAGLGLALVIGGVIAPTAANAGTPTSVAFGNQAGTSYRTVVGSSSSTISTTIDQNAPRTDSYGASVTVPAPGTTGAVTVNGNCLSTLWEDSPLTLQTCDGGTWQQFTAVDSGNGRVVLEQGGKAVTATDTRIAKRTLTLQDAVPGALQQVTSN